MAKPTYTFSKRAKCPRCGSEKTTRVFVIPKRKLSAHVCLGCRRKFLLPFVTLDQKPPLDQKVCKTKSTAQSS